MPRQRSGRALRLRRPLEEPEDLAGLAQVGREVLVDELGAGASISPRPSCCVVCGRPLVGYSTCGLSACVVEILRRSRGGRG